MYKMNIKYVIYEFWIALVHEQYTVYTLQIYTN